MAAMDIVIGVVIGVVLGIINALILRTGVRYAVKCGHRFKATLIVIGSYALRYVLIVAAIYAILIKGTLPAAVTTLCVLGAFTIIWAVMQRGKGTAEGRG